ncbi:MAG: DNA-binding domain-containing protein [Chthoniobacteraceae bacterium]
MSGALMRPLTGSDGMQRSNAAAAEQLIKPNDRLTSFERLQIYNQQYWWRLLGCFGEDFRGVRAVLGERSFEKLAVAYLDARGSTSWSLRELGQHLPAFIKSRRSLTAPHTALAFDMARIEWARILAFDTAALPLIDPLKLARRDPATLRLKLQPYVELLELRHPVDQLLKKLRESNLETASASNAVTAARRRKPRLLRAKPASQPILLAVHRVDFLVYYKRLDREAFALLGGLRDGATLADACERAFAKSKLTADEAATKLREWFNVWTRLGWLAR